MRENELMLDNEFKATRAKLVRDLADRPFPRRAATPTEEAGWRGPSLPQVLR